jgi:hypothetical protein
MFIFFCLRRHMNRECARRSDYLQHVDRLIHRAVHVDRKLRRVEAPAVRAMYVVALAKFPRSDDARGIFVRNQLRKRYGPRALQFIRLLRCCECNT